MIVNKEIIISVAVGLVVLWTVIRSLQARATYENYTGTQPSNYTSFTMILSIFASLNGGFMVIGLVQVGYEGGLSGYILGLAYLLGIPLLIVGIRKLAPERQKSFFGIDALIFEKYGIVSLLSYYTITAIVFAGVLGGQFLSIIYFLKTVDEGWILTAAILLGLIATFVYTWRSGFKGVVHNDKIQAMIEFSVCLIFPSIIILFLTSNTFYNLSEVFQNVIQETDSISGTYYHFYPWFACLFLVLSFLSRADLWIRLKQVEAKQQKQVIIWSCILLFFFYFAMTTTGIIIKHNIDRFPLSEEFDIGALVLYLSSDNTLLSHIHIVPALVLQIICLGGIAVAIFSSIDSYLQITSQSFAKVVLWKSIPKLNSNELTDDEKSIFLANARLITIAVGIFATIFAVWIPDIVDLASVSFSIIGTLVPIILTGIFKKNKIDDWVGYVPIISSMLILIIVIIIFPSYRKNAFIPSFVFGCLVFGILYFFSLKRNAYRNNRHDSSTDAR